MFLVSPLDDIPSAAPTQHLALEVAEWAAGCRQVRQMCMACEGASTHAILPNLWHLWQSVTAAYLRMLITSGKVLPADMRCLQSAAEPSPGVVDTGFNRLVPV